MDNETTSAYFSCCVIVHVDGFKRIILGADNDAPDTGPLFLWEKSQKPFITNVGLFLFLFPNTHKKERKGIAHRLIFLTRKII